MQNCPFLKALIYFFQVFLRLHLYFWNFELMTREEENLIRIKLLFKSWLFRPLAFFFFGSIFGLFCNFLSSPKMESIRVNQPRLIMARPHEFISHYLSYLETPIRQAPFFPGKFREPNDRDIVANILEKTFIGNSRDFI